MVRVMKEVKQNDMRKWLEKSAFLGSPFLRDDIWQMRKSQLCEELRKEGSLWESIRCKALQYKGVWDENKEASGTEGQV